MKAIFCIDKNGIIGFQTNQRFLQPVESKLDQLFFQAKTENATVVMGANTFKSLKRRNGLPNRRNVVLSKSLNFGDVGDNVYLFDDLEGLKEFVAKFEERGSPIWCIGGAEIFEQFYDQIDEIWLTEFDEDFNNLAFLNDCTKRDLQDDEVIEKSIHLALPKIRNDFKSQVMATAYDLDCANLKMNFVRYRRR